MAAHCPKCDYKLRIRDWRPECPKCGVNLLYYGIEDSLRKEADVAEYHHAMNQPKFDRLIFSLIGHKLSIVRLAIGLLPIAAMLLPMGKIRYLLPFGETAHTVNLVSIIRFFTGKVDLGLVPKLFGSELIGGGMVLWAAALVSLLLVALLTLVGFFLLCLSCSPRGMRRNIGFPIAGIALSTVSFVCWCLCVNVLSARLPGVFSGSASPWAYLGALLCFGAMIAVNLIWKKKKIEVKYKDVSEFLLPYDQRPSTIAKKEAQTVEDASTPAES